MYCILFIPHLPFVYRVDIDLSYSVCKIVEMQGLVYPYLLQMNHWTKFLFPWTLTNHKNRVTPLKPYFDLNQLQKNLYDLVYVRIPFVSLLDNLSYLDVKHNIDIKTM